MCGLHLNKTAVKKKKTLNKKQGKVGLVFEKRNEGKDVG